MKLKILNGGYCHQFLGLVDKRSLRFVRFHATFLAVEHATRGWVLVDTGYGGRFGEASSAWPYCLYRYATPVKTRESLPATLARAGIPLETIREVVITHFHADHVGGLKDLPQARFHYHADALAPLLALSPFKQVRSAFLPKLLPSDLATRSRRVPEAAFSWHSELALPLYDLFGDGSIQLVNLPGHAPGHCGVLLQTESSPLLWAADAFWDSSQVEKNLDLFPPVLRFQWDPQAYQRSVALLRAWRRRFHSSLLACHDAKTQAHVEA